MALGHSIKTSEPLHASHDVFSKSSTHPRNYVEGKGFCHKRISACSYLREPFFEERYRECSVLDTDPHELCRVATNESELYPMLPPRPLDPSKIVANLSLTPSIQSLYSMCVAIFT